MLTSVVVVFQILKTPVIIYVSMDGYLCSKTRNLQKVILILGLK